MTFSSFLVPLDIDRDACLNDSCGRRVTPRATTEGFPPTLILPAAYASVRSFNRIRGNLSEESKAEEVLRALKCKKTMIGVGVSRGGDVNIPNHGLGLMAFFGG
jgi:hypothetical protein